MKIVIDIPECFYEYCKAQEDAIEVQLAIKNGTPLPEGAEILTAEAYSDLCLLASNGFKTGKWIETGYLGNDNYNFECSECHHSDQHSKAVEVHYCWYCGAKMEGSEEDAEKL